MADETCLSSVVDLEEKLNSAKQSLVVLNDNIRRFVGRGPKDLRVEKYKQDTDGKKPEYNKDKQAQRHDFAKPKRRMQDSKSSVFHRLSGADNETRPRINSRVIRELPSREEVVEAQGTDSESKARNRRMFGSLLGTLQKFCQEESRLKQKEDKKAQIEKKLEKQELQERALLKKERESLFLDRKRKQFEIRCLEIKMARLKDFKVWESSMIHQKQQIRTKTKPHLFFRPRTHSSRTEELLLKSKAEIESIIERRKELLESEDIHYMDEDFTLDDSNVDETHIKPDSEDLGMKDDISIKSDKNTKENKLKTSKEKSLISSIMVAQEA